MGGPYGRKGDTFCGKDILRKIKEKLSRCHISMVAGETSLLRPQDVLWYLGRPKDVLKRSCFGF